MGWQRKKFTGLQPIKARVSGTKLFWRSSDFGQASFRQACVLMITSRVSGPLILEAPVCNGGNQSRLSGFVQAALFVLRKNSQETQHANGYSQSELPTGRRRTWGVPWTKHSDSSVRHGNTQVRCVTDT